MYEKQLNKQLFQKFKEGEIALGFDSNNKTSEDVDKLNFICTKITGRKHYFEGTNTWYRYVKEAEDFSGSGFKGSCYCPIIPLEDFFTSSKINLLTWKKN